MLQYRKAVRALTCVFAPLALLSVPAGAAEPKEASASEHSTGLIEKVSTHSFADTIAKVRAGIEKRPLRLFAEIDHAKGAASADLELAPSTLFIFGNPKGGTPLMKREPRMGIALPLKMHVFEENGKVIVSYPDVNALAKRYGLDPEAQPVPNIGGLLAGLAAEATE